MKVYKGKNAFWFILIFIIYNVLPLVSIRGKVSGTDLLVMIIVFVSYYCGDLIFVPIMIRNRVELFDDYFVFCYGFSTKKIYIRDIQVIKKSHNPIASSANSLDRIYIETKSLEMYISLKKNDEFIEIIKEKMK